MSFSDTLEGKLFIIVDDDETTLFYSSAIIKRFFYQNFYYNQVISFKDPDKAVEYFEKVFSADPCGLVILLDINMPSLSGWDVLDRLQEMPKDIKDNISIIVVSSSIDPQDKIKADNYSMVIGYIQKPLSIKKLKDLLELRQRAPRYK